MELEPGHPGAEPATTLGDTTRAAMVRQLLEPYADRNIVATGAHCLGPAAYFLGLLDLTLDQPDLAVRRFQHAATSPPASRPPR